ARGGEWGWRGSLSPPDALDLGEHGHRAGRRRRRRLRHFRAISEVIFESYPPSYLLPPFQDFRERRSARPGFARTGLRDVVGIHPRPQLRAEKHSPGGV